MGVIAGWRDLVRGGGDEPARAAGEAEVLQLSGLRDLLRVGARVWVGARVRVGDRARARVRVRTEPGSLTLRLATSLGQDMG